MLPQLPDIPGLNQYPILQGWLGLGSLILIAFGIYVSIRKMNREDRGAAKDHGGVDHQSAIENVFASMPKQYYDGPLRKLFDLLHEINGRLKDVQRHIKESDPPPPRRRR